MGDAGGDDVPTLGERSFPSQEGSASDIDRFIDRNRPTWDRLDALTAGASAAPKDLTAEELGELVRLHLRVSAQLSYVRTHLGDREVTAYLSTLVARSNAVVHGTGTFTWAGVWRAMTQTFPAALWHLRVVVLVSAVVFFAAAGATGLWLASTPAAVEASLPAEVREAYLERDFEAYYSSEPGTTFAARVFTNNAAVGALAFGSGVLLGLPTLLVLILNGLNIGVAAGIFHAAGEAGQFWSLILPHGLLEITAVLIAGGAGLSLGWSVLVPGDRPRREALAEQGRRAVVVALGLVLVFAVAGLLEGYVTAAPWPTWARVGTGAVVWFVFCLWIVLAGRAAAAQGRTGALGETGSAAGGGFTAWALPAADPDMGPAASEAGSPAAPITDLHVP